MDMVEHSPTDGDTHIEPLRQSIPEPRRSTTPASAADTLVPSDAGSNSPSVTLLVDKPSSPVLPKIVLDLICSTHPVDSGLQPCSDVEATEIEAQLERCKMNEGLESVNGSSDDSTRKTPDEEGEVRDVIPNNADELSPVGHPRRKRRSGRSRRSDLSVTGSGSNQPCDNDSDSTERKRRRRSGGNSQYIRLENFVKSSHFPVLLLPTSTHLNQTERGSFRGATSYVRDQIREFFNGPIPGIFGSGFELDRSVVVERRKVNGTNKFGEKCEMEEILDLCDTGWDAAGLLMEYRLRELVGASVGELDGRRSTFADIVGWKGDDGDTSIVGKREEFIERARAQIEEIESEEEDDDDYGDAIESPRHQKRRRISEQVVRTVSPSIDSDYEKEENDATVEQYSIVEDPNHVAVSKRNEKISDKVRNSAASSGRRRSCGDRSGNSSHGVPQPELIARRRGVGRGQPLSWSNRLIISQTKISVENIENNHNEASPSSGKTSHVLSAVEDSMPDGTTSSHDVIANLRAALEDLRAAQRQIEDLYGEDQELCSPDLPRSIRQTSSSRLQVQSASSDAKGDTVDLSGKSNTASNDVQVRLDKERSTRRRKRSTLDGLQLDEQMILSTSRRSLRERSQTVAASTKTSRLSASASRESSAGPVEEQLPEKRAKRSTRRVSGARGAIFAGEQSPEPEQRVTRSKRRVSEVRSVSPAEEQSPEPEKRVRRSTRRVSVPSVTLAEEQSRESAKQVTRSKQRRSEGTELERTDSPEPENDVTSPTRRLSEPPSEQINRPVLRPRKSDPYARQPPKSRRQATDRGPFEIVYGSKWRSTWKEWEEKLPVELKELYKKKTFLEAGLFSAAYKCHSPSKRHDEHSSQRRLRNSKHAEEPEAPKLTTVYFAGRNRGTSSRSGRGAQVTVVEADEENKSPGSPLKTSKLFQFPLPLDFGLDLLDNEEDFVFPYDLLLYAEVSDPAEVMMSKYGKDPPRHPPSFKMISSNIYIDRKPRKAVEIATCHCRPQPSEPACGDNCLNRMMYIECTPEHCPCGPKCTNQRFQRKEERTGLEVFWTSVRGFGVRTTTPIPKGSFVIEYRGEIVSQETCAERMRTIYKGLENHYFLDYAAGLVIDGCRKGTNARFVNHGCEPNCHIEKWYVNGEFCVGIFASVDIAPGTELSYDYRFESFGPMQQCHCGSKKCRGFIKKAEKRDQAEDRSREEVSDRIKSRKNALQRIRNVPIQQQHHEGSDFEPYTEVLVLSTRYKSITGGSLEYHEQRERQALGGLFRDIMRNRAYFRETRIFAVRNLRGRLAQQLNRSTRSTVNSDSSLWFIETATQILEGSTNARGMSRNDEKRSSSTSQTGLALRRRRQRSLSKIVDDLWEANRVQEESLEVETDCETESLVDYMNVDYSSDSIFDSTSARKPSNIGAKESSNVRINDHFAVAKATTVRETKDNGEETEDDEIFTANTTVLDFDYETDVESDNEGAAKAEAGDKADDTANSKEVPATPLTEVCDTNGTWTFEFEPGDGMQRVHREPKRSTLNDNSESRMKSRQFYISLADRFLSSRAQKGIGRNL